jgi:hypothetical protein
MRKGRRGDVSRRILPPAVAGRRTASYKLVAGTRPSRAEPRLIRRSSLQRKVNSMSVKKIHDDGQKLGIPSGKVLFVVDSRAEFDQVVRGLESAGIKNIEYLVGEEGLHLLERIHTFFFSDSEEPVLQRHIEELKAGHGVVAFEAESNQIEKAVDIASNNGARFIVHFGLLAITWLKR